MTTKNKLPHELLLTGYLLKQTELQRQLIQAQQEIIRLHQKIESLTPPEPAEDVHWHKVSAGLTSEETLASDDVEQIRRLLGWVLRFGQKYVQPYVHLRVYGEIIAHMSRGISSKLAELEVRADFAELFSPPNALDFQTAVKKRTAQSEAPPPKDPKP